MSGFSQSVIYVDIEKPKFNIEQDKQKVCRSRTDVVSIEKQKIKFKQSSIDSSSSNNMIISEYQPDGALYQAYKTE